MRCIYPSISGFMERKRASFLSVFRQNFIFHEKHLETTADIISAWCDCFCVLLHLPSFPLIHVFSLFCSSHLLGFHSNMPIRRLTTTQDYCARCTVYFWVPYLIFLSLTAAANKAWEQTWESGSGMDQSGGFVTCAWAQWVSDCN